MNKPKPPTQISRSIIRRVGLFSGIGIAGAIASIFLSLSLTLSRVEKRFTESETEAVNTFDLFFLTIQRDLFATSQGLAVHDNIDSELLALSTRNNAFLDMILVGLDGEILSQRNMFGRPDRMSVDVSEWRDAPPPFGEVAIGPIHFEQQVPYVEMVVTVTDDISLPAGFLLVRVDLTELWNKTLDIQVGRTGYAYIVDGTGQLAAFRNRRVLETGSKLQDLVGRTPQELAASELNLYKSINKQYVLGAAQSLKTVRWFAVVEQPISEALAIFLPVGSLLTAAIVLVTALLRSTIHFANSRIASPLLSLRDAVAQMENGKLDARVSVSHDDELGQLGYAFNLMAAVIQNQTDTLRESEARYRLIADNAADVIWVMDVESRRFKYFSPSVEKLRGYTPKEAMAQPVNEALTLESIAKLEDAMSTWILRFLTDPSKPISEITEVDQPCKDGSIVKTEVTTTYVLNEQGKLEIVGVSRDITDRKRAEEALRTSEERLARFMNSASDSFYMLDANLNFIELNAKALELIGKKKEDVIGKNIADLVPDVKASGRYEKHLNVLKTGEPFVVEDFIPHPLFGGKHFVLTSFKVGDGLGVIAHDITDRKQAEARLQEQLDELRRWQQVTLGREGRILALKREVNELLEKAGQSPRYPSAAMK